MAEDAVIFEHAQCIITSSYNMADIEIRRNIYVDMQVNEVPLSVYLLKTGFKQNIIIKYERSDFFLLHVRKLNLVLIKKEITKLVRPNKSILSPY